MNRFKLRPEVVLLDSLAALKENLQLGQGDMVVTDRIFGHLDFGCDMLFEDDYGVGEPTDQKIDAILNQLAKKAYNRIIAVGGGTVIDIAKLLVDSSKKTCEEIFSGSLHKDRTLVAVPTTCGTGSEVTNISIVAFVQKQTKIGRVDEALYPDQAVLIPALLQNLPYSVFITSSIDALIHAVESYLSPKATVFSRAFSQKAICMILSGYVQTQQGVTPNDYTDYLIASLYAGIAFSNAGCGLVHAMSYPIGGTYHLPHGAANAKVFMDVMAYYDQNGDLSDLYAVMEEALGKGDIFNKLKGLIDRLLTNRNLGEMGMDAAVCKAFAASVMQTQQRLVANAFLPVDEACVEKIYKDMLVNEA